MNREKQIEEMANLIYRETDLYNVDTAFDIATTLHDANYRRASEVAREIFEEIEKYNRPPIPECEAVYVMKKSEFEALKNKYTESEDEE